MANHRKHRGYRTQKVIADYLKRWWAYADTAGAGRQGEDILNIPTISIEVKARADFQPLAWIKQAEFDRVNAEYEELKAEVLLPKQKPKDFMRTPVGETPAKPKTG